MPRHRRDTEPRWALVVWPDIQTYADLPCCIPLHELDMARDAGATVVAVEDDELCAPKKRTTKLYPPREDD